MIISLIKNLLDEISSISEEIIEQISFSLPEKKINEKIICSLSYEGKMIYSLLTLKRVEFERISSSSFSSNSKDLKENLLQIKQCEIALLENFYLYEIEHLLKNDSDIEIKISKNWDLVLIKEIENLSDQIFFYNN